MHPKTLNNRFNIQILAALAFVALLLHACANIGTLSGGPEDKTPPKLTGHNLKDTGFRDQYIVLEFDEYVRLNQPEKYIILLPETGKKKFESKGKKVIITFEQKLAAEQTYQLLIRGGIADNNADNPYRGTFIFSTGQSIDSSFITIRVPNAGQYEKLKVCINTGMPGDSFKNFNSSYALELEKDEGTISFNGLKKTTYNIWVYTDMNGDRLPDFYKPLGFVSNASTDSVYQVAVSSWYPPFEISKAQQSGRYLHIHYPNSPDFKTQIKNALPNTAYSLLYSGPDSALIYTKDDTSFLPFPTEDIAKLAVEEMVSKKTEQYASLYKDDQHYILKILLPDCYLKNPESDSNILIRKFKSDKPDTIHLYNYIFQKTDTLNLRNLSIQDYQSASRLEIKIQGQESDQYDVSFYHEDKPVKILCGVNYYTDLMTPGNYKILIYPSGFIRKFNPLNMEQTVLPLYEKTLYLKASWEEILEIKL